MDVKKPSNPYDKFKKKEQKRCAKDPVYFIESYINFKHPIHGITNLKLYDYQKDLIELYAFNNKVVSKMPRQSGKTLCGLGVMLWKALFYPESYIFVASYNMNYTMDILEKIRFACELLPDFFKTNIVAYDKSFIEFANGSKIFGQRVMETLGKATSLSMIYFDEIAYVETRIMEQAWLSLMPTLLMSDGKCIVSSTPNSKDDFFDKIWNSANDRLHGNGFTPYAVSWKDIPRSKSLYQFEKEMREQLGDERWMREFECEVV